MRILIIADEEWNDFVYGNNVLTNWFDGMDAEFAEIYCSPGKPINSVCDMYFQITDSQMFKSIFGGKRAGGEIVKECTAEQIEYNKKNAQRRGIYGLMKKISLYMHTPVMMMRDFIWLKGRYNEEGLKDFVENFNPDVVFCPRYVTPKLMRLERKVSQMTSAPFVAFTADNEVALDDVGESLLARIRRRCIHKMFVEHVNLYTHYLMFSADQAQEYKNQYKVSTSTFYKSGVFPEYLINKQLGNPIRLVYAGRLYCNRWKSLAEIGKALTVINQNGVKMVLDVYTQDQLTTEQRRTLTEDRYIYMKGCVSPDELRSVYENADIALHVESLDEKYKKVTRVSFSTKIIDLMASTCAIWAICWDKHAGYQYLREKDAAFCISNYQEILPLLSKVCTNTSLISEYAQKAYLCGRKYHNKESIQRQLLEVFEKAISNNKLNEISNQKTN